MTHEEACRFGHGALDKLPQQLGHSYPQRSSGSRVGGASRAILGNGANSRSGSVSRPSVSDHATHKSDHCRQARCPSWSDERCAASRHSAALFVQSAILIIVATSQNLQTLDIFTPSACRTKCHRVFHSPRGSLRSVGVGCSARAARGHAVAPLRNTMKSRRLIASLDAPDKALGTKLAHGNRSGTGVGGSPMSQLGHEQTSRLKFVTSASLIGH